MSKLINELKQEHIKIKDVLSKLYDSSLTREQKVNILLKAKTMLIEHLAKEDEQLYPALYKKAETDYFLKRTLDLFAKDTDKVSILINNFFDKYSIIDSLDNIEFIKDIAKFMASLKNRITKEEIGIYQSYEKLGIN